VKNAAGIIRTLLFFGLVGIASICAALEVHIGDWETAPEGTTAFLYYGQYGSMSSSYSHGRKVDDNARMATNIGILRFVHWLTLGGNPFAPNLLIPIGQIKTGGSLSPLGSTGGVGDVIIALPYWPIHNHETREYGSITLLTFLPTGSYDKNRPLNLGENRRKHDIQLGYQHALGRSFFIELEADGMFFLKNSDAELTQKPLYEVEGFLSYEWAPGSRVGVGLFYTFGGKTTINGVDQDDRVKTTKVALTGSTFFDAKHQLIISLSKDMHVENGLKEDKRLNFRLMHIF